MARIRFKHLIPWAVALLRYRAGIINWSVEKFQKIGQKDEKNFDNAWGPSSKELH